MKIFNKRDKTVIGLMSGTSQDGIDAVIMNITDYGRKTKFKVLDFETYSYPSELKEKIHDITTQDKICLKDLTRLNYAIGKRFAYAANDIREKAGIKDVDFIGSHGQTLTHLPEEIYFCGENIKATIQIGEPSIIAKETGILTVADFRPCDIALGGEGAPLSAYTDYLIFYSKKKSRAVINIGGISNVSLLPKSCSLDEVGAFDIGPGNMCIDEAMRILYNKECDLDGSVASSGKVNKKLFDNMLKNDFFKKSVKSTGRVDFGADFVKENIAYAKKQGATDEDIIANFTNLSAYLISKSINDLDLDEVILCGGGAKNSCLTRMVEKDNENIVLRDIKDFGLTVDNREAAAFAILANETVSGNPSNLGSRRGVLGKIILP
ncbi:MAG: anhydro-N-acetylmuramic acid kinase [Nanoarchaeota archaeon]|nr:anhydro-N-acetylmuramic acid kinase [Nanoarchaeota archaeon]